LRRGAVEVEPFTIAKMRAEAGTDHTEDLTS
jgi:hypothetical protein